MRKRITSKKQRESLKELTLLKKLVTLLIKKGIIKREDLEV